MIAAHDEAETITATLAALTADLEPGELEIVVVCNGCSDDTAELARGFGPEVRVLELDRASKIAALREGDRTVSAFPRIYLDADVVLATSAARRLIGELRSGGVLAASTELELDTSRASPAHRRYLEIWRRLPTIRNGLTGRGVYGLSEVGRRRFGEFPQVTNDDAFVDAIFAEHERAVVDGASSLVAPVGSVFDLVRRKTRIARGKRELCAAPSLPSPRGSNTAWLRVVTREPRLISGVPAYVCVALASRIAAQLDPRAIVHAWSSAQRNPPAGHSA